jgi:hypothetical protein
MTDPYEQAARERRNPAIQTLLDAFVEAVGIEQDFVDSSEHPYHCRCDKCLSWWASMGPEDPDGPTFGPFSQAEVEACCEKEGKTVWW